MSISLLYNTCSRINGKCQIFEGDTRRIAIDTVEKCRRDEIQMMRLKTHMENVREEEKKIQIRRRRIFELRGKFSHFNLISASSKWIVVVPHERETSANFLYVFGFGTNKISSAVTDENSIATSEEFIHVEGHTHPISAIDFSHSDHSKFSSASSDGDIRIWNGNDAGVIHLLSSHHRHKAVVSQLLFHRSKDTLILSSSPNERLLVWDWMTNKISFAVPDENSIATWSIDSRSIFTSNSTLLQHRDGVSGRVLSSCELSPCEGTPYKIIAITTNMLLVLSEKEGTSRLALHDTTSLNCVHTLIFPDSSYIFPWYNSNLGLLTLVHKSNNSMESHQYFDCSPYLRSHLSRRVLISSQNVSHDWAIVSGEMEWESSPLSSIHCLPSSCLNNVEEEIISVLHAPFTSPSLYNTTIRYAPIPRTDENVVAGTAEEEIEQEKDDSSSKNQVSPSLDSSSSQLQSSSIPHSGSNNQLAFSLKWDFLSQVTQVDYRSKEEEGEDNLGTSTDTNQERDRTEKTTNEGRSRSDARDEETERSSTRCLSIELNRDSLQSDSRSLSLESTEISWTENEHSLDAQGSNGTANMATVTLDEEEERESRARQEYYANMDRFILEETVANLEIMLRKSERDRSRMQKKMEEMEADLASFKHEVTFKDERISELEGLLSGQSSAQ